ncbi:hypothetical protein M408DRAFT_26729, partial [Serendipita vermifera MAFF 305830]
GKRIISGSYDDTIRVWDAETGRTVLGPLQGHSGSVNSVSFSPDGKRIVSGSCDATIRVWDVETGQTVLGLLQGHSDSVSSVSFSPDGKRIVSGSDDYTIRVWDTETGQTVLGPLQGHRSSVLSVSFSPDGKQIVSGSNDNTIRVWDAETGRTVLGPLHGHSYSVNSVLFSPDGKRIVFGSDDYTILVWDAEAGQTVLGPLKGHSASVWSVSFSPDGKRIVSGSGDNTIRVWDAETDESTLRHHFFLTPIALKSACKACTPNQMATSLISTPPSVKLQKQKTAGYKGRTQNSYFGFHLRFVLGYVIWATYSFNLYNIKHIPGTETMPILLVLDRDLYVADVSSLPYANAIISSSTPLVIDRAVTPDGGTRHGTTAIRSKAAMIPRVQGGYTALIVSTSQVLAQQQQLASANKPPAHAQ